MIALFNFDTSPPLKPLILLIAVGMLAVFLAAAPVAAQEVFCAAVDSDTLAISAKRVWLIG